MEIDAVLFDVGGPLDTEVTYERLIDEHIRAALRAEGIEVTSAQYEQANACAVACFASNAYQAIIWHFTGPDVAAADRVYAAVAARSHERHIARGGLELRDGISDVLAALYERGLALGLAANQPATAIAQLDRSGVGRYFRHREVSGIHGYRKPDVRLFLRACEDLGVPPERCVMVGDRIDNDIAPARLLGMRAVRFRTGRHAGQQPRTWEEIPEAEAHDVTGLREALLRMI